MIINKIKNIHKEGDILLIRPTVSITSTMTRAGVGRRTELKVIKFSTNPNRKTIEYVLGNGRERITLAENVVYAPKYYWFVNSKGCLSKDIIDLDSNLDEYRKKWLNYFESAEEARETDKVRR